MDYIKLMIKGFLKKNYGCSCIFAGTFGFILSEISGGNSRWFLDICVGLFSIGFTLVLAKTILDMAEDCGIAEKD